MQKLSLDLSAVRDTEEVLFERSDIHLRLANNRGRRNSSSVLINRMYSWRGYKCGDLGDPAEVDQITLQACRGGNVFGTVTLSFESGHGLAADAQYRREIDAYRRPGAKFCELTRLAVDPEQGSKEVLGALFHLAYIHAGLLHKATDVFIEVNPRHVSFYQHMLHFRLAGECRICERVNALAVLLHVEIAYIAEQIALHGGHRGESKNSLYPYFFSSEEERGLPQRILRQQQIRQGPLMCAR